MTNLIEVEDRGGVRLLAFNRPDAANAFNEALYHAAAEGLESAAADAGVSVVVLTGRGRAYCAGTDLHEMAQIAAPQPGASIPDRSGFPHFLDALTSFPKPIVAAVNGAAVGLGLTMLLHCDVVFMAEGARLRPPFTLMGVAPEAASSYLLPRRMGFQAAAAALYPSAWITADEAVAAGLAYRSCPADQLLEEALSWADSVAAMPLASLLATKRLLRAHDEAPIARARELENQAFTELLAAPSTKESVLNPLAPS